MGPIHPWGRSLSRIRGGSVIDVVYKVLVLSRWVHFASTFVLFGCAFSTFYMGPMLSPSPPGLPWTMLKARYLIRVAALVALASGIAWLVASLANMSGGFGGVIDREFLHAFFFDTPFGPIAAARLVLLAALLLPALLPLRSRFGFVVTALLAAVLLVSQAWLGHAAEGGDTLYGASMIVSYAAHVLAGGAWVGGLPMLLLAIFDLRSRRGAAGGSIATLDLLYRFSAMAFVAVGVIVASGVANAGFRIGTDFWLLAATTYGTVLAVKLGFVTLMLGLAAYNRFIAMPRLRRIPQSADGGGRSLATSIGVELALGALVLAAAAVLGITPPPH